VRLQYRFMAAFGLVLACAIPSQAQAAEVWSGATKLTALYPATDGMYFNTVYANTALSSCDSGTRWFIAAGSPNYATLTAALMAAFMADKQVNLNINVVPPQCGAVVNRFVVYQ
jgi:hypothetical protein